MEMVFTNDERIFFVERKGALKSFDLKTSQVKTITTIPVNTKYTNKEGRVTEAEEGLMGLLLIQTLIRIIGYTCITPTLPSKTRSGEMGASW